ncbi:ABC transporter permease subunit [Mycetohabitans sp. B4]|nr:MULTISPECIES: ABC transporter permease subunit [unclassified Mycetohabitans]MCG1019938.1 ABC transporter permease subunit [Mycetohabitans sp. B4]MCG1039445.1 ABC transporter permease subunit [Mycetohabitans sp. B7]
MLEVERIVIRGIAAVYAIYLLLPILLLSIGSVGELWMNSLLPSGITVKWYADIWLDSSFRSAFTTSLVVALSACAINTILALPLAYSLYHKAGRGGSAAAKIVSMMPIVVPTITLGFGYIIVFNTDVFPWLGTLPLLIVVHAVHTLPYLTNTLLSDLRHSDLATLERAAATLGATELQQFFGIAIPNLRKSLLSGLMMVAAISVGEFGLSNLLASFQNRTYPVVLWQAFYGTTGFACAATVILLVLASTAAFVSSTAIKKS